MDKNTIIQNVYEYASSRFPRDFDGVPVSGEIFTPSDIAKIVECALGGWITEGKYSEEFSNKLETFLGIKHSTLCNSGSSSVLLAMLAAKEKFNVSSGFVITCATGFPTTVYPIIQAGLTPLFVDIDSNTLNIDLDKLISAMDSDNVVGVIQAHTLGLGFDAQLVRKECDKRGLFFIEDICDALGGSFSNGERYGTAGHLSVCSFFPAHHITTGEGGAVFTNDGKTKFLVDRYRDWGRACWCKPGKDNTCNKRFDHKNVGELPDGYDHKYTFTHLGYNLKMTDLQAALGSSQMDNLPTIMFRRKLNYELLYSSLFKSKHITVWDASINDVPFGFPIYVHPRVCLRNKITSYLENKNIKTRPIFAGNLVRQPVFKKYDWSVYDKLDNSDLIMSNAFWVGCWPGLKDTHLQYIVDNINMFFDGDNNGA